MRFGLNLGNEDSAYRLQSRAVYHISFVGEQSLFGKIRIRIRRLIRIYGIKLRKLYARFSR